GPYHRRGWSMSEGGLQKASFQAMMPSDRPITRDSSMSSPSRPDDLPDFKNPPVNEVVLSLQFASIPSFHSAHIGLFWEKIRQEYPKVSEQAPLQAAFETFGVMPVNPASPFHIEALLSPPMPRFWFEELDGNELLQIQQDRIIHN